MFFSLCCNGFALDINSMHMFFTNQQNLKYKFYIFHRKGYLSCPYQNLEVSSDT